MFEYKRKVHLDFHTSPYIPNIGECFDKKQFQEQLIKGNVQSITLFAKGHHGYMMYPSKVGTMHPNLKFDLIGKQIEAAHEIGVKAPIYIPVGWSDLDSITHPEWSVVSFGTGERQYIEVKGTRIVSPCKTKSNVSQGKTALRKRRQCIFALRTKRACKR
jgi:hypothetical protein